jgi:hypothetical protein
MFLAKERLSSRRPSCQGSAGRYGNKTGGEFCGPRYNACLAGILDER